MDEHTAEGRATGGRATGVVPLSIQIIENETARQYIT